MPETIFSKIIRKEIPADIVYEDEDCLAFHDIAPKAPVHVLIIPKKPIENIDDLESNDAPLIGHMFCVIRRIAAELNLQKGYRVVTNCGKEGGQEVSICIFICSAASSFRGHRVSGNVAFEWVYDTVCRI
ncbi:MAG: histidine triad nucleotide-binding protein [Pirellulaceae bacterium]